MANIEIIPTTISKDDDTVRYRKQVNQEHHDHCDHEDMPPQTSLRFNPSTVLKTITVFISIIVIVVGAVVWAADKESSLKAYAADQVDKAKNELVEESEDKYVKKYDFGKIEQSLKDQGKDIDEIKRDQKDISKKLDRLYDGMIKRQRDN